MSWIATTKRDGGQLWSYYRGDEFVRAIPNVGTLEESWFAEIDRLKAERRWIPVAERLPVAVGWYLAATAGYPLSEKLRYDPDEGWTDDDGVPRKPSHWMPIPAPPEVDR